MNLRSQRKLAAKVLDCGVNRVWIAHDKVDEISIAITREEIRKLINEKAIKALPENSQSRSRARVLAIKKKKGRKRGAGSRKGKKFSVISRKTRWMNKIRAQRRMLRNLRDTRVISVNIYRNLYRKAKGGIFRSVAEIERYINDNNLRRRSFG